MGWDQLIQGFGAFFSLNYILACFIGAFLGTVIGVLPGVGPTATMTLMLPFTLTQDATFGLIMLTGILCGAQYGGSTTSILVNIPGEAVSVVTCLDGYQMTLKGRGGAALALVAAGSFVAGTIGIIGTQIFAPLLANLTLAFGPPEYFALLAMCFIILSNLSGDSPVKGSVMFALGWWLSSIGICPLDNVARFTLGAHELTLGIEFMPVAVGLFGISEVILTAMRPYTPPVLTKVRFQDLYPNRVEIKRSFLPIARGSILGFFVGLLPGPSAVISTFISYGIEKRLSKNPEEFGHGALEGVVGPESANNGAAVSHMIPLLTLGIPFNAPMAVLLAALIMHKVEPGPLLFQNSPQVFWTFIAALYIGNVVLLILNLPLVGFFARIATTRPAILLPFICTLCLFGVYSSRNNFFDVWVMIFSGIAGFVLRQANYPVAPLVIGLILGPMTENNLRKTLMMFRGNLSLFLDRPIAMAFLILALGFILFKILYPFLRKRIANPSSAD